jgi:hypothetical protein
MRLPPDRVVAQQRFGLNMPIDLLRVPPEEPIPTDEPSRLVWSIVFLVLVAMGAFVALLLWTKGDSTHTSWFWVCVGAFPVLGSLFIVLQRFSQHADRIDQAMVWNEVRERYQQQLLDVAMIRSDAARRPKWVFRARKSLPSSVTRNSRISPRRAHHVHGFVRW